MNTAERIDVARKSDLARDMYEKKALCAIVAKREISPSITLALFFLNT